MENSDKRTIVLTKEQLKYIIESLSTTKEHYKDTLKKMCELNNDSTGLNVGDAIDEIILAHRSRIKQIQELTNQIENGDLDV